MQPRIPVRPGWAWATSAARAGATSAFASGPIGHASHQNGLDVDIYYPRADGRERAPRFASEIDRALSQELVDRFLARGAQVISWAPTPG